jgi:hypothetical protein
MATLPTTAAPRAAAEAATRRTRAAARKDVAATATANSAGAVTSPSPPAPPAKRKRKRPQPIVPTSEQSGAEAERMGAILQLDGDGDVSLGAETASLPATPAPPPTTTPPPPSDPATVKNLCTLCNAAPIFNYERSICVTCLEKLVCKKCFTTATEYRLKYHFFKDMYDYCQAECKKLNIYPVFPGRRKFPSCFGDFRIGLIMLIVSLPFFAKKLLQPIIVFFAKNDAIIAIIVISQKN